MLRRAPLRLAPRGPRLEERRAISTDSAWSAASGRRRRHPRARPRVPHDPLVRARLDDDVPASMGARSNATAGVQTLVPTLDAGLAEVRRIAASSVPVLALAARPAPARRCSPARSTSSPAGGAVRRSQLQHADRRPRESQLSATRRARSRAPSPIAPASCERPTRERCSSTRSVISAPRAGRLLRVLQEREVVPVGRAHPTPVDVRFLRPRRARWTSESAATDSDRICSGA